MCVVHPGGEHPRMFFSFAGGGPPAFEGCSSVQGRARRSKIPLASRGARPRHVQTGRWVVCPARLPR
eukprot:179758-Pyramimonas_sp.AAC.1